MMRKYTVAPHPFILEPAPDNQRTCEEGEDISFGLTLVGRAIDYLPYFIYALDELGRIGIGKGRGKYELRYEGDFEPFRPHIRLGEYVHAGKGSSFGLGR